jgi:ribosomal protein S18 acetylase RimI-like enzyme
MPPTNGIDQARPDERAAALELAYRHLPPEARRRQVEESLQLIASGTIDPAGIWVARRGNRLQGVQVCVPLGGASFLFWPPVADRVAEADALVAAALAWCRAQGAKLGQLIVPPAEIGRTDPLIRHGFRRITQLHYLRHDLRLQLPPPDPAIRFEPPSPANEAAFRDVLARSYEETLDCPELTGTRTIDDVLAGYRRAGRFRPDCWWLIRAGETPAGVLILTELPDFAAWDLSYVGVIPEQRRRGVGRAAACHALASARAAGAPELLLAVDTRNTPARRLYRSLGFQEGDVRDVYLYFFAAEP